MINIRSLGCVVIILLHSISFAQWISVDKYSIADSPPVVQLISDDASGAIIKVDLPGFRINEFTSDGKIYHEINCGGEGIISDVGFPEISHITKILAIPNDGSVNIEVIETSPVQVFEGINIPPARESWREGQPETPYTENALTYASEDVYPSTYAKADDPVVFRDFRIARISIFPIRYSPAKHEIQAVSSITIKINYTPGMSINPKTTPNRPIAPSFAKLYRKYIFNYEEMLQRRYNGMENGHDIMLCIMPDMYIEEFQPYAEWKHKSGTEIFITKFSEIGANQSNADIIKNYILNVYTTWENIPDYILLIGDYGSPVGNAPVKYWTGDGWTFVNEDYFVELEGNDYFPEMMIGRFTNYNGTNGGGEQILQVMVNKFLKYEKYPYTTETAWYKKATVCSNNNYSSQVTTKRFTADRMRLYGGFTSVDTMMSNSQCTYDVNDIVSALNNGRSFLNYRGEGWDDGWHTNCYYFGTSHVNSLNNSNKLTFVTNIGCGAAMFDAGNCFGEAWLEMGSLTGPLRGGCAFIGPTSNTHTAYNNAIDKGIYTGMFPQPGTFEPNLESPGEALLAGKLLMYERFGGGDSYVQYHYKIYCVLGDPSMHIWKDIPNQVTVTHPNEIFVGYNQVQITVKNTSSGLPVGSARVCISGNGVYETAITDGLGIATLDITPNTAGTLNVVVTGGNVIPSEDTINVSLGAENVTPYGNPVVTDLDGNDDGLINPNENCSITYTLKNWGSIISNNVYAVLSIPDSITNVEMVVDSIVFGNIAPNDSITGAPFQFFIEPECPVGSIIPFKLHIVSTTTSWDYNYNAVVHGCNLDFNEFFVDDAGNVLQNYRMDPGETVKVRFKILNIGDDIAPDVKGTISTNDPYMTIVDSIAIFGTILPDSNSINESDTYTITVSQNCPVQYNAAFSLKLETQNGLYPYILTEPITLPVSMPTASDPTGPDGYGYYAYSSHDMLWEQRPEFNWVEIKTIGTVIPKPGGLSDFTQTVNLPFNFKYYGNDFSQLRVSGDGWIAFGSGTQTKSLNYSLPCLDTINNMVAVFWDDFFSNGPQGGGRLYYYSDPVNHRFIVEWDTVPHYTDLEDKETFQIILLDPSYYPTPTGDGELLLQYNVVKEPGSCTVGIENNNEDIGISYLYNEYYDATANELVNGIAIKFTTKSPTIVSVDDDEEINHLIPTAYSLDQNFPNPFNPETRISYSIPEQSNVKISIYDINGTLINILHEGIQSAGRYEVVWNGESSSGYKVGSGVYFYRMQANSFVQTKKMILLK
ncbi:MAG: T9SS C-terminal target domain-containing protein [Ignavibacteriae bacterium]|nr:MAG: T9SS C-terminal target domain-containing protein [Chlorobiota bacterium]MBE7475390.1 T9SS type A sorting domain-containing protein [Ignavibacteriales bacterium]MBL1122356.1 T9SS C-terminal target domain-containing protein [Ignavibacteriota bacterium]MCC7094042.1 T9SS type A sorting domain-containing protein [Ignavibacteriaceae bacterium]MCE7854990.1 T9SS C-terminal target domain-containing protein [Ignavibacteria bacterium CHB3]MEB2295163.1 C25 family cysteine peptidase [Ignavibacteria